MKKKQWLKEERQENKSKNDKMDMIIRMVHPKGKIHGENV